MKKHTTMNLDTELLDQAREALGTRQATETVHRALEEVVAYHRRLWLAEYEFPDLTPESLERIRKPRTFATDGTE
jgi:Bacterial antitoxin of type II TA system, VapB